MSETPPTGRTPNRLAGAIAAVLGATLCLSGCATGAPVSGPTVTRTVTVTAMPRSNSPHATSQPNPAAETGKVTRVVDGDTIEVAEVGTIRIQGIDTPEVGECGFEPAAREMVRLVQGRVVRLVPAGTTDDVDKYGRLLRYVDVDGHDSGLVMISKGLAVAKYDSRDGYGFHPREPQYIRADEQSPTARGC